MDIDIFRNHVGVLLKKMTASLQIQHLSNEGEGLSMSIKDYNPEGYWVRKSDDLRLKVE